MMQPPPPPTKDSAVKLQAMLIGKQAEIMHIAQCAVLDGWSVLLDDTFRGGIRYSVIFMQKGGISHG